MTNSPITELTHCVACNGSNLEMFLDLSSQPLANNYHDGSGGGDEYPLGLNLCRECFHAQLTYSVDPEVMFSHYLYQSGTNQTFRDYCDWFAQYVTDTVPFDPAKHPGRITVLDIACNDGTQLDSFKKLGWNTQGVDPAANLAAIAKLKGHDIIVDFWPSEEYKKDTGINQRKPTVIIAQNVLAHTPDPLIFLQGCREHLDAGGVVFIQTSQCNMFANNEFDTVYHEHISFFGVGSMDVLASRAGLRVVAVEKTPIHGESYLFTLCKDVEYQDFNLIGSPTVQLFSDSWYKNYTLDTNSFFKVLTEEVEQGRENVEFYRDFAANADKVLDDLEDAIKEYRDKGITVVGYGAAAKGMTVLNARNIQLDWIVDDAPLKQGLFTPGTNTEIKDRSSLDIDEEIVLIPLAWNFFDEIKRNVEEIRSDKPTTYLKYFPRLSVE